MVATLSAKNGGTTQVFPRTKLYNLPTYGWSAGTICMADEPWTKSVANHGASDEMDQTYRADHAHCFIFPILDAFPPIVCIPVSRVHQFTPKVFQSFDGRPRPAAQATCATENKIGCILELIVRRVLVRMSGAWPTNPQVPLSIFFVVSCMNELVLQFEVGSESIFVDYPLQIRPNLGAG
jgi:hypothetical protein